MPYKDPAVRKAKQAEYSRRWYLTNQEHQKRKVRDRKHKTRAWWAEYKKTLVCWHCGESAPECIDLHHVISTDKKNRADSASTWATNQTLSPAMVLKKIEESCVPLCANCHRKVHAMHKRILREQQQPVKSDILEVDTVEV